MDLQANVSTAKHQSRADLVRYALTLTWLTVAWMIVEASVALIAGILAGSVTLSSFGVDSLIELLSASVVLWRLLNERRCGRDFEDRVERVASRVGGVLLSLLAVYIVTGAAWSLWTQHQADASLPGLVIACVALPMMFVLGREKLSVAQRLESRVLRADAVESFACGWLSLVVVVGLVANLLIRAWWIDAVTSLGIVGFVVKEAREAWIGDHE